MPVATDFLPRERIQSQASQGDEGQENVEDPRRDRYGRLLAYVHLTDGHILNQALVQQGPTVDCLGVDSRREEAFLAAEEWARTHKRGSGVKTEDKPS